MQPFTFITAGTIVFRTGAAADIDAIAGALLGPRVLVVTDDQLQKLGLCDPLVFGLQRSGTDVTVFDAVEADPSESTVLAARDMGRSAGVTGVVGLGGGSSLDVAKAAALLLGSGEQLSEAWGVNQARGPRLPLVLIPTTAGTGSEVTPIAIITVGGDEKLAISSPILLPDVALLDPALTLGLPPKFTAATGIDAMVHAIEAYTSASTNNNPISRSLAREALRLLGAHVETAVKDGANPVAREAMLLGSTLAGQAFANSPVAAVHALAYPLGGIFHIAHGLSNALVLIPVLRFNLPAAAPLYAEIAADIFPHLAIVPAELRAEALLTALTDLMARLGIPRQLRDFGIGKSDLPQIAAEAMKQTRLLVNNPMPITERDAFSIYSEAW